MSLHVDDHRGNGNDHPLAAMIAVAAVLLFTCVAIYYMGNAYRVTPTYLVRQQLATPF